MTTEEITAGNKLIRKFIGHGGISVRFEYDKRWDHLMPVVTKINHLGDYHFIIYGAVAEVVDLTDHQTVTKSSITDAEPDIKQAVWETCVQFLEYYNQLKPNLYGPNT